jgi:glycosyltransferase involved in cell wall biosynthesis
MNKPEADSVANQAGSISVIILVPLEPDALLEAIASVAGQSCPGIELIVVKRGADAMQTVRESAADRFGRVLYQTLPADAGQAEAGNAGLDFATGDYLLFLGSNDRLQAGHLTSLRDALEADREAVLAYGNVSALDPAGPLSALCEEALPPWRLLTGQPFPLHAALLRKSATGRFDPQLEPCADWDFLLQLQTAGKFIHVREATAAAADGLAGPDLLNPGYQSLINKWRTRWPDAWLADTFAATREIPALQHKIAELETRLDSTSLALDHKTTALDQQAKALAHCRQNLDAIVNSRIWRLSSGLRTLGTRIKQWLSFTPASTDPASASAPAPEPSVRDYTPANSEIEAPLSPFAESMARDAAAYPAWILAHDTLSEGQRQALQASLRDMLQAPLISVLLPIDNPPADWLAESIESVRAQIYPQWELCVVGEASEDAAKACLEHYAHLDERIRVLNQTGGEQRLSRASHTALNTATGEYFALLNPGERLADTALYCVAQAILGHPEAGLIYADEDALAADGQRQAPRFKPDWNYELFLSHDYIGHLLVCGRRLAYEAGGFRTGFEGAHAYDLALRCAERLPPAQIVHIPRIIYHARPEAQPAATAAALAAVNSHLSRTCPAASAELLPGNIGHKIRFPVPSPAPLVSIVIPTRNRLNLIRPCLESLFAKTRYPRYEILVVDNGSDEPETLAYLHALEARKKIKILRDGRPFNFAALTNAGVAAVGGNYVLLLNNDIEVIAENWLDEMVSHAARPGIGAVGARLWYPDDTLQHGGILLAYECIAWHAHTGLPRPEQGYCDRGVLTQSLSAVTAACLLIRRDTYLEVGGLDEQNLAVDFNDVDFCLTLRLAGYRNIWTPFAELYHHESASRRHNLAPDQIKRAEAEKAFMQQKWEKMLHEDPAYNPNLMPKSPHFALAAKPSLAPLGRHA